MNWIKNVALLVSTVFICYILLVMGDWMIFRINTYNIKKNIDYKEAKEIEKLRASTEDGPLREKAISEGYSSQLFPHLFDDLMDNYLIDFQYPLIAALPHTDTYYCNEGYGIVKYRSDRFGFRNEDSLWEKTNLKLMIGDSAVQGACVPNDSTLPMRLSAELNSPVLNLGSASNNPSHYLTYGNLFIPKLEPTEVYLVFVPNDNGVVTRNFIKQKYILERQQLFSSTGLELFDVDTFKREGNRAISVIKEQKTPLKSVLDKVINAALKYGKLPNIIKMVDQKTEFEMTEKTIRSINDLCNANGCNVVVSFIPNSIFWRPDDRADNYGDQISKLSKTLGLRFVDGRDFIDRTEGSTDFAIKGPHLSPLGYKKMAIAIGSN